MLITTRKFRQASFRNILHIVSLAALLCACQPAAKKGPPVNPAAIGTKTTPAIIVEDRITTHRSVFVPASPTAPEKMPLITRVEQKRSAEPTSAPPSVALRRSLELPESLPSCRITRLSSTQWRAVSTRRFGLSDSPPSLMEDAIITAGIHARLQNLLLTRKTAWQYSSNAGIVGLKAPSLTRDEAVAALQTVLGIDKVAEVRLTTALR